jgi:hypothetical protein
MVSPTHHTADFVLSDKTLAPDTPRLLLEDSPLQVLPALALALGGLNESLILQQLHYLMRLERHVMDGVSWVYNTYEEWQEHFPFWSLDTIKRAIHRLERGGFVRSTRRWNRSPWDQTKWYTIHYDRLYARCAACISLILPSDALCPDEESIVPSSSEADCPITLRLPTEISIQDPPPLTPPPVPKLVQREEEDISKAVEQENPQGETATEPSTSPSTPVRLAVDAYTPGFLQVFEVFSAERREGKRRCFALWQAHGLEDRAAELVEKIERLKITTWPKRPAQYRPSLHTWLQLYYDDDLEPMPVVASTVLAGPNPFDETQKHTHDAQCEDNAAFMRAMRAAIGDREEECAPCAEGVAA